jgi:hypothetical protein
MGDFKGKLKIGKLRAGKPCKIRVSMVGSNF